MPGAQPAAAAGSAVGQPSGEGETQTGPVTPGTATPPATSQGGQPNGNE